MHTPNVETLTLGALDTNCYIVWCPQTLECVIIDPADSAQTIIDRIQQLKLKPISILLTHGHFDHVLGVLELYLAFDLPFYLHKNDLQLIKTAQKSAEHWLKKACDPVPTPTHFLAENSAFSFGTCQLVVIETPGHTPGSVSFMSAQNSQGDSILFSGDTLFKNGVGRTDFTYSSPKDLEKSVQKLLKYPPNTVIFSGHGDVTTVAAELQNTIF